MVVLTRLEVVVIAGPGGVGKTSVANEVSVQLRRTGVAHAVVDTDALDDVFPVPDDQWRLTERHLRVLWESYRGLGVRRLILTGVYLHRPAELDWIVRATRPGRVTLIRLEAAPEVLTERVRRREVGSAAEAQLARTHDQARLLASQPQGSASLIATDSRTIESVAAEIIAKLDWC